MREGDPLAGSMNKYLAELLGTFVLVGVGSMAILNAGGDVVVVSFGFGLALMAGIYMFGGLSGAHFNPAVTVGMFLKGKTTSQDAFGYLIAQLAGGVLASSLVLYVAEKEGVLATLTTHPNLDATQTLVLEALLTAIFVMVILRATTGDGKAAPFAIPMALVVIHLAATGVTGASVNPARSLGPAIVGGDYTDIWVYIVGPLVGAAVGYYLDKLLNADS